MKTPARRAIAPLLPVLLVGLTACSSTDLSASPGAPGATSRPASEDDFAELPNVPPGAEEATFAGGCFWCMESVFEEIEGVLSVTSGYIGGDVARPTYRQVGSRTTGHAEAIRVVYDPKKITYEKLLWHFWRNVDPVAIDRQFCDAGDEYRSEIFFHDDAQKAAVQKSIEEVKAYAQKSGTFDAKKIATRVSKAGSFWPAEEYHQDFYKKNPVRYLTYRTGCGRDRRLQELWGDAASH